MALSPRPGTGVPHAPRCRGAEAMWAAQSSAARPCCALPCSPSSSPGAPMGCSNVASECPSLHPAGPVPTWAGGRAGRDEAEIKLLMSPSVTRPPITRAGNEEMMERDWGRGAGYRGLQHGGNWEVSPSLHNFLIAIRHILWGGGQKEPRGDQATTIPDTPMHLRRDQNFLPPH